MIIATSLAPGRKDKIQHAAVKSWHALGATVVSVNVASEIEGLRNDFPDVTFVAAPRSGEKFAGKPVPYIGDILDIAAGRASGNTVVGLINSDIILRDVPAFCDVVAQATSNGAILLPRVDIDDLAAAAAFSPTGAETFSVGYDGIFLNASLAREIPNSLFCIGMPFWDYWLPMVTLLKNRPLKTITSPVALHVAHPTQWDKTVFLFFHALIGDMVAVSREAQSFQSSPAFDLVLDTFAHVYSNAFETGTRPQVDGGEIDAGRAHALADFYDRVQEVVVHHIKTRAAPLAIDGA